MVDDREFIRYLIPITPTTLGNFSYPPRDRNDENDLLGKYYEIRGDINIDEYPQRLLDMFVKDGILIDLIKRRDENIDKILNDDE